MVDTLKRELINPQCIVTEPRGDMLAPGRELSGSAWELHGEGKHEKLIGNLHIISEDWLAYL